MKESEESFEIQLQVLTLCCIFTDLSTGFCKFSIDLTDQELIQGFLRGGKGEYKQIVGWISDVVRSKLWARRVAPEDVIADTTMKLLISLRDDAFRLESTLKTYVQRITLYTLVDASRRVKNLDSLRDGSAPIDESNPHTMMEEDERLGLFRRIVELLPEKCRQLWEMAFGDNLKCREIAQKIGSSEGAVRTSLSRCKDQASEIFEKIS